MHYKTLYKTCTKISTKKIPNKKTKLKIHIKKTKIFVKIKRTYKINSYVLLCFFMKIFSVFLFSKEYFF